MKSWIRKLRLDDLYHWLRPHPMYPWWRRWLQWALVGIAACFVAGLIGFLLLILIFSPGLPDVEEAEGFLQAESTIIYDREGNPLYSIHDDENREIIEYDEISPYLIDATVAVEDDQFYDHRGFDVPCLAKAVAHEAFGIGIRRGCSTITQQLVKWVFLSPEQTYTRKIKELLLSIRVESHYEKEEILKMYINQIFYGNNAHGAELAAERYFGKSALELNLTESAILASLPNAPTFYSPYGENAYSHLARELSADEIAAIDSVEDLDATDYVEGLIGAYIDLAEGKTIYIKGRTDIVLDAMLDQGMITSGQHQQSLEESWTIEFQDYRESLKYPHFVFYVRQLVEEKYGEDLVARGGLRIYTTIDPVLQAMAEEAVEEHRQRNFDYYDATNASLVAVQPQTGQILVMVGSADYHDNEIDGQVNVATSYKAPGSSFKPFIFAAAFLEGFAPASVIYDVQTSFNGNYPQNYDGRFQGPLSIRESLGKSRNIAAVKAYYLAGGEEALRPLLSDLGIDFTEEIGFYGWPLSLGSGEVRLVDLVGAYAVFANNGVRKSVSPILKIENNEGEVLEQWEDLPGTEVIDPQAVYLVNDILSDTSVNLGPRLSVPGYQVAAKTGTSNSKDANNQNVPNNAWTIGYTPKLSVGVWTGNANGDPLYYTANGYDVAAPIWNSFMADALNEIGSENFNRPSGITEVEVTTTSGLLPSEFHSEDMITTDIFATFNVPTEVDDRFVTLLVDSITGLIATEYSPQWSVYEKSFYVHRAIVDSYSSWQAGIDSWVAKSDDHEFELPPTEEDNLHTIDTFGDQPRIAITSPNPYSSIDYGRTQVEVDVVTPNGMDKVEFYLNGTLQFIQTSDPYAGTIRIPSTYDEGSIQEITVYAYDALGYRSSSSIEVRIAGDEDDEEASDETESSQENEETEGEVDDSEAEGSEETEDESESEQESTSDNNDDAVLPEDEEA